jgi:hypothetical protein
MARYQWLLMVAIAVGLVGMHHLVHTHPAHTMTSAIHPDSAGASPSAVLSTSMMGSGTDCCDPMNMVGHLCLAVLTAIAALAAALIVAAAWRRMCWQPSVPLRRERRRSAALDLPSFAY